MNDKRTTNFPTVDGGMNAHWSPRKGKWPWRDFLTSEEVATLAAADDAKRAWLALNKERAAITNRAIQRAKYAALKDTTHAE